MDILLLFFIPFKRTIVCICSFLLFMIILVGVIGHPPRLYILSRKSHLAHSYHSRANASIFLVVLKNHSRWQNHLHETLHMWLINDHDPFVMPNGVWPNVLLPNLEISQETRLFHSWDWNPEILLHWAYDINEPLQNNK